MSEDEVDAAVAQWTEAELNDLAAQVWGAVEYTGTGRKALVAVMKEILR